MTSGSWRTRLASAVVLLVLVAGGVRVADWLLSPIVPLLLALGGLAAIYLFLLRQRR